MKAETPMKSQLHRSFVLRWLSLLRYVEQHELRFTAFEQHGVPFPLVVTEGNVFTVYVPVARLQLPNQCAFGYLPASQEAVRTDIVGECGKEQAVTSELAEHRTEFTQVFPQERVRLPLRHSPCRIPFARL